MTADIQWQISYGPRTWQVQGFRNPRRAREHVRKHFFDGLQQWGDLRPERQPSDYKREIEDLNGKAAHALLDDAACDYVKIVRRHTTSGRESIYGFKEDLRVERGKVIFQSLEIVSQVGVYTVFKKENVSGMVTSYRPRPGIMRGKLRPDQFLDAARRKLKRARP